MKTQKVEMFTAYVVGGYRWGRIYEVSHCVRLIDNPDFITSLYWRGVHLKGDWFLTYEEAKVEAERRLKERVRFHEDWVDYLKGRTFRGPTKPEEDKGNTFQTLNETQYRPRYNNPPEEIEGGC